MDVREVLEDGSEHGPFDVVLTAHGRKPVRQTGCAGSRRTVVEWKRGPRGWEERTVHELGAG